MDYQQNIKNSALRFTLKKTSIQLVTSWLESAKNEYDIPSLENANYDELEIENDFVKHLSSAINSLVIKASKKNKSIPGWSFGYICGHMEGALSVKWSNQFLITPSKEYKDLMKLKTILELLKIDQDLSMKVETVYDYFTTHCHDAVVEKEILPNNVISLSLIQKGKLKNTDKERCNKEFVQYFSNLLITNYTPLMQRYDHMCRLDLSKHLNQQEIINIVGEEHFS